MATFKQYKIDTLITALKIARKKHGNCSVEMSIDSEGNEFHPIGNYESITDGKKEVILPFSFKNDKLVIYPCEE